MTELKSYRSGFISIIGRPNVGKSTLMNQLMGEKLSIVSDKPQTTRNRIQCILSTEKGQAIFLDTPGIHKPQHQLGERMNKYAVDTLSEVDLILYVVSADSPQVGTGDQMIRQFLATANTPVVLVVNKKDLASSDADFDTMIRQYGKGLPVVRSFVMSAINGDLTEELTDTLYQLLPEGPQYYPDDIIIDHPERFLAAEIIREKALLLTRDEIPHSVAVDIESMKEKEDIIVIEATIYVERESQKGIIIGAKGSMLKEIGSLARADLENLLGSKVYLTLWAKARKDWRDNESFLKQLGYRKG